MADSSGAWVFYVAQNGTAVALNVVPDGEASIVATVGSKLPSSMQGDKVLGLAAGASGKRPQVGVLSSNGTVYYSLYFSFWIDDNWSKPQRKSSYRNSSLILTFFKFKRYLFLLSQPTKPPVYPKEQQA